MRDRNNKGPYRDTQSRHVYVRRWHWLIHRTFTVTAVLFGVLYSIALLTMTIPLVATFVFVAPWAEALGINYAIHSIAKKANVYDQ